MYYRTEVDCYKDCSKYYHMVEGCYMEQHKTDIQS